MLKIAVTMITLNNEGLVLDAVTSAAGIADKFFIVDGGSTDGTIDDLRSLANAGIQIKVDQVPWAMDFARQRNNALEMIPHDYDWIIRLDRDEAMGHQMLSRLRTILYNAPEYINAFRMRQHNFVRNPDDPDAHLEKYYAANLGGWEIWPRIFRNIPYKKWHGVVHEHMVVDNAEGVMPILPVANINAPVLHYGWLDKEELQRKEAQYMRIPGSGFYKAGSLTNRKYVIRETNPAMMIGV